MPEGTSMSPSRHTPRTSSGWLGSQPGTRGDGAVQGEVMPSFPSHPAQLRDGSGYGLRPHGKPLVKRTDVK